ncbi:hypothetical protein [Pokkaliibacter plantistimulans]|nr:hypothetical protein [Pokkaliibacter plantistimulans]
MILSSFLEGVLQQISPNAMTEYFLWIMALLTVSAAICKKKNTWQGLTHYTPTLLTTLGILGTFAGIIVGLLDFNVTDIEGSIPALLAGLQTAFITSLAGMLLSIAFKVVVSTGVLTPKVAPTEDEDQLSSTDFYALMKQQSEGIAVMQQSIEQQTQTMAQMAKAIGGDGESSLMGQFKLLRTDLNDNHKELSRTVKDQQAEFGAFQERLWDQLQNFAEMLSKSATETVINALKDVIKDFNRNLTEQFGENFKQLNAAVERLVDWQENYRLQLEQMGAQYSQGVQAITATEQSVSHISEKAGVIPEVMALLQSVMEVNQHQIGELDRHLTAFSDVRDRAVEAVPEIRKQIDATLAGAQAVSREINEGMGEVAKQVEKVLSDSAVESARQITGSANELRSAIVTGSEEFVSNSHAVNSSLQSTSDVLKTHADESRQMLRDALDETNSVLRTMVTDMKEESGAVTRKLGEVGESVMRETDAIQQNFSRHLERMQEQLRESIESSVKEQRESTQKVLSGLSQHAEKALGDTGESLKKQIENLDRALEHELTKVMNHMGQSLATISGKFTTDYKGLVNEMDRIVRYQRSGNSV